MMDNKPSHDDWIKILDYLCQLYKNGLHELDFYNKIIELEDYNRQHYGWAQPCLHEKSKKIIIKIHDKYGNMENLYNALKAHKREKVIDIILDDTTRNF